MNAVHCAVQGSDDEGHPTWRCVPDFALPSSVTRKTFRLSKVNVQCEGCTRAGDPSITAGSCIVQYSITEVSGSRGRTREYHHRDGNDVLDFVAIFGLCLVAFVCVYRCMKPRHQDRAYPGIPLEDKGAPYPGGPQYHHHHYGGGGLGGGGFGTGMLSGLIVGNAIGGMGHHYGGGGYYDGGDFGGGGFGGDGEALAELVLCSSRVSQLFLWSSSLQQSGYSRRGQSGLKGSK